MTLSHFALPVWLDDVTQPTQPQGWERQTTSDEFVTFCSRMGTRWGGSVDWWITLNEPLNVALPGGYIQGSFPPGVALDVDRASAVRHCAEARASWRSGYDRSPPVDNGRTADGDGKAALVSVAAHLRTFHPFYPDDPADQAATNHVRYIANDWFLNAVSRGDWDDDFDGNYTGPNDVKGDPTLKGRLDTIGVNYYSDTIISASYGLLLPVINASILEAGLPTDRPKTDFNWDIYPQGFGTVLDEAAGYGLPLVVTENGVADRNDVMRGRFLAEHLLELGAANLRGDHVLGYFHWSLLDNFEWANGFCPKFSLHSVDPTTAVRATSALEREPVHFDHQGRQGRLRRR